MCSGVVTTPRESEIQSSRFDMHVQSLSAFWCDDIDTSKFGISTHGDLPITNYIHYSVIYFTLVHYHIEHDIFVMILVKFVQQGTEAIRSFTISSTALLLTQETYLPTSIPCIVGHSG